MRVLDDRLGHALAAAAEQAKIDVALHGRATVALDDVEPGLHSELDAERAAQALQADQARIVAAAHETLRQAGVPASSVQTVFFTGGSTGLPSLVTALSAALPAARAVRGDRFASVASGLCLHAGRVFSGGRKVVRSGGRKGGPGA